MKYLHALRNKKAGELQLVKEDLNNLLNNTVGIGEHTRISEDVAQLVSEVDQLQSELETIEKLVLQREQPKEKYFPEFNLAGKKK